MPVTPTPEAKAITIPEIKVGHLSVLLKSVPGSPLIVHAVSAKAVEQIEAKQQQKGRQARGKRNPKAEYHACFYMIKGKPEAKKCVYGFPAIAFKLAMVGACRYTDGLTMTKAFGCFHVPAVKGSNCVQLIDHTDPRMVQDNVTLPNGALDIRYRPYFDEWAARVVIQYNERVISPEQIVNLAQLAGFSIGVGDWRVEKGGSCGMFEPSMD